MCKCVCVRATLSVSDLNTRCSIFGNSLSGCHRSNNRFFSLEDKTVLQRSILQQQQQQQQQQKSAFTHTRTHFELLRTRAVLLACVFGNSNSRIGRLCCTTLHFFPFSILSSRHTFSRMFSTPKDLRGGGNQTPGSRDGTCELPPAAQKATIPFRFIYYSQQK